MGEDHSLDEELLEVAGRGNKRRWEGEEDEEVSGASDSGDEGPSNKHIAKKSSKKKVSRKMNNSSDEEFDDGYGSDLMGDAKDRAVLMAMTELDREYILSDRAEARDQARESRKAAQLTKQKHRTEEVQS